jgi:fumarate hydratase class II
VLAVALFKSPRHPLAGLRSAPGLGELSLPENEPGSSIMPGKSIQPNAKHSPCCAARLGQRRTDEHWPVLPEILNVFKPLIAHNVLQSVRLLAWMNECFERHCVHGITANRERIDELMERSLMLVTALTPHIGYDKAAEIAKYAHQNDTSLKAAALALQHVTDEQYEAWVIPSTMIHPG